MSSTGRKALVFVLAAAVVAVVVTGCGNSSVAKVNGRKISRQEYYNKLERLPFYQQAQVESGMAVLNSMIEEELLLSLAEKEKCRPTDAQVNERYAEMEKNPGYPVWAQFMAYVRQSGLTKDQIKDQVRIHQAAFNLMTRGISVPEKDVKASYEENKAALTIPQSADVAMIQCNTMADAAKAMQLLKTVEFATVAKQLSDEPNSKANGGRIGAIYADDPNWDKAVSKKVLATKKGEITGPIAVSNKSGSAVLIFKVIRINPPKTPKYEEVKYLIWEQMMRAQGAKKWDVAAELEKFRGTAKIKVNIDRYRDKLLPKEPAAGAAGQKAPAKTPAAPK